MKKLTTLGIATAVLCFLPITPHWSTA